MPEVTSHAPGAPSWADLATSDAAGALSFYNALFGWEDDPKEMGPDSYYHMQRVNGLETVALYQQTEATGGTDIPPHWNVYFTVENVEETMASITQNGGTVVFGPQDVFEAGRMAFCQDPQGAFFAIWQPKLHIGARIKQEAGAMFWHELLTTDQSAAAVDFYIAALGVRARSGHGTAPHVPHAQRRRDRGGRRDADHSRHGRVPAPLERCTSGLRTPTPQRGQGPVPGRHGLRAGDRHHPLRGPAAHRTLRRHGRPPGRTLQRLPAHGRGPPAVAKPATRENRSRLSWCQAPTRWACSLK